MRRVHLDLLGKVAAMRGGTYLDDCLAAGTVSGDFLLLHEKDYLRLRQKHTPPHELEAMRAHRMRLCLACDQFWIEQQVCMKCTQGNIFQPWSNLPRCPLRKWS